MRVPASQPLGGPSPKGLPSWLGLRISLIASLLLFLFVTASGTFTCGLAHPFASEGAKAGE